MKRALSFVLVLATLLSCMVITSYAAAEKPVKHEISFSSCDYSLKGWGGFQAPTEELKVADSDGSYIIKQIKVKEYKGPGSYFNYSFCPDNPIDATGAKYLVFHMYVNHASIIADKQMRIERNAATNCDRAGEWEDGYTYGDLAEGGLKDGWNTVKIPMDGGSFDKSKFQWFRSFNAEGIVLEEELIIAIDKAYLEMDDGSTKDVSECNMAIDGWHGAEAMIYSAPKDDDGKLVDAKDYDRSYIGKTYTGNQGIGGINFSFKYAETVKKEEDDKFVDVSNMKFFVFDFYVSDPTKLGNVCMELTSAGEADKAENQYCDTYSSLVDYELKAGWNTVYFGLDNDRFAKNDGGCDWTKLNFFRIFNNSAVDAGDGLTVAIDNVRFWDGEETAADGNDIEKIEVLEMNDPHFIVKGHENGGGFYFNDAAAETIIEYKITHAASATGKVTLISKTAAQLKLSVSMDNKTWTDIYTYDDARDEKADDGLAAQTRFYDLSDVVDFNSGDTIYVKYADSSTENGWGGQVFNATIRAEYEVIDESTKDPHYTTMVSCDSTAGIGGGWEVTTETKLEGKGALTKTIKAADKAGAAEIMMFSINFADLRTKEYDTTNMAAVVFDMYVEHADALKDTEFQMEFASGGTCDVDESNANKPFSAFVAKGTTWQDGWNTIVVPFDELGAGMDRTKLNWIRFYNNPNQSCKAETVVAFDNFRLWDGSDGSIDTEVVGTKVSDTCTKFVVDCYYETKNVVITGDAGDKISVSFDGKEYFDVAKVDGKYSLAEKIDTLTPNFQYIFVKAVDVKVVVTHKEIVSNVDKDMAEATSTTHSVSINTCSTGFGDAKVVKSEPTPVAGTTCVKKIWNNEAVAAGGVQTITTQFETAIDCTGMDTLEFDVYFANQDIIDKLAAISNGQFEITSGGTCDAEECHWNTSDIVNGCVETAKPEQWNHVVLPISAAGQNDLKLEGVNYWRVYFFSDSKWDGEDEEGCWFAIDNLRMTDREAMLKIDAMPYVDAANAATAALRELLGVEAGKKDIADGAITAANVAAVKEAYAKADAAKTAIPTVASSDFKDSSFLRNVKKAIEAFEKPVETATEAPAGGNETQAPAGNETQAPAGNETTGGEGETEAPAKKGCGSVVIGGAVVVMAVMSAAGAMIVKKKED